MCVGFFSLTKPDFANCSQHILFDNDYLYLRKSYVHKIMCAIYFFLILDATSTKCYMRTNIFQLPKLYNLHIKFVLLGPVSF